MHQEPEKFAFIVGSALLDIVSTITEFRHIEDNIGTTSLNFGGVAYNVAVNLRKLDVPTTLCTAMNDSPLSQMIVNELTRQHVRTHFKLDNDLPDAIYNGMFHKGKEIASVWVNTVERAHFEESFFRKGMQNAACLLITSDLSVETMNCLIKVANELKVPVFIGGASLMEVGKLRHLKGKVDYYFVNENEMDMLTEAIKGTDNWSDVVRLKNASFIVTKGGDGAVLYKEDGTNKTYKTEKKIVEGNVLGAGDLFMSVAIKEIFFSGKPLDEAIQLSMKIASQVLERHDANIGTTNPLAANIQVVTDKAHHDKLTGALNRHGLERYLTMPNMDLSKIHVLIVDADYFKNVNDTYGHDVGDQALVSIVQVVRDTLRKNDIVARFGGEEFICLLQNMNNQQAEKIAERVRHNIEKVKHTSEELDLTVSIGLSKWQEGDGLDAVVKRTDKALYTAKKQGRNQVVTAF